MDALSQLEHSIIDLEDKSSSVLARLTECNSRLNQGSTEAREAIGVTEETAVGARTAIAELGSELTGAVGSLTAAAARANETVETMVGNLNEQVENLQQRLQTGGETMISARSGIEGLAGETIQALRDSREQLKDFTSKVADATDSWQEQIETAHAAFQAMSDATHTQNTEFLQRGEDNRREFDDFLNSQLATLLEKTQADFTATIESTLAEQVDEKIAAIQQSVEEGIDQKMVQIVDQGTERLVDTIRSAGDKITGEKEKAQLERQAIEPLIDAILDRTEVVKNTGAAVISIAESFGIA